MKIDIVIVPSLIFLLAGCVNANRTEYQRPDLNMPTEWRQVKIAQTITQKTLRAKLSEFNDPVLEQLLLLALEGNNDLALAGIKLKLSQNAAGLANTNLTPDFTLGGTATNTKSITHGTRSQESYSASLSMSYELDLWGKLALIREKNEWEAVASEFDYQATELTIIKSAAQYYWNIALLNKKIDNQVTALAVAEKMQLHTQALYSAGKVSKLDLLQAEQTVIDRVSELNTLKSQQENTQNALILLLNNTSSSEVENIKVINLIQAIPIEYSTPISVISQRPDVRATESRLRSMLAGSDAAKLSFYPTLSLEGALSAGSQLFSQWFSDPTRVVGSAVSLPFIQWNTVQLTIEQSDLQVQQAAVEFRKSAYNAVMEINNAIDARVTAEKLKKQKLQSLSLGEQRLALTISRYQAGAISYETVLNAQNDVLSLEDALAQHQYDYLFATLQLWLAQGGGSKQ